MTDAAARERSPYAEALKAGFDRVRQDKPITNNTIPAIQRLPEQNEAGYRQLPGTVMANQQTGKTVYTPPQGKKEREAGMDILVQFLDDDGLRELDGPVKMPPMHHRFETIYPFYDGSRTGPMLNIVYRVQQGLPELPVPYLSRYPMATGVDYDHLLH